MLWNKRIIKIIGFTLIFITIFTFSVVLATDDSVYVWSAATDPLASKTNAKAQSSELTNTVKSETKEKEESSEKVTKADSKETSSAVAETVDNSLNLESGGAVLIEQKTGQVLYEHNMHEQLRPASVTKVMSLLLIMEALDSGQISLTDKVPCTEDAAGMGGSQIWLEVGEELTVDEMLKAICVVSANDCTEQFRHL